MWVVCPSCHQQSWVLPPHGGQGCPLVVAMYEAQGLKLDSERMAAVRMGISAADALASFRRPRPR